jgi:hypothetical protein
MSDEPQGSPGGQMIIYRDGTTQLQVRLDGQTVWLTQAQLAELYQTSVPNVSIHIRNVLEEAELLAERTVKDYLIVRMEGSREVARSVEHYSLPMILAIGYRVRSARGTAFRQWATARLSELLVKGFTLDDERIKAGRTIGADYFDELLARIRDIRSSERLFYQKITDIYATSIDYDPSTEATQRFFQTVQNKLHFAAHGHTAAEIVSARADAAKPHMGLTSWKNSPSGRVRKSDVIVAKNYLGQQEIEALNRLVTAYLEFAEIQARNHRAMHMADWIAKLDDFLRLTDSGVLTHAGKISHQLAVERAETVFLRFEEQRRALEASQPNSDFDRVVEEVKRAAPPPPLARPKRTRKPGGGKRGGGSER